MLTEQKDTKMTVSGTKNKKESITMENKEMNQSRELKLNSLENASGGKIRFRDLRDIPLTEEEKKQLEELERRVSESWQTDKNPNNPFRLVYQVKGIVFFTIKSSFIAAGMAQMYHTKLLQNTNLFPIIDSERK